mmetsp:Transcript_56577/g.98252  ORF Transcript_56577/g.98252 Transcript_56577/m.98252 type:complete len:101 (+) Transcript_56577:41-343(+)
MSKGTRKRLVPISQELLLAPATALANGLTIPEEELLDDESSFFSAPLHHTGTRHPKKDSAMTPVVATIKTCTERASPQKIAANIAATPTPRSSGCQSAIV